MSPFSTLPTVTARTLPWMADVQPQNVEPDYESMESGYDAAKSILSDLYEGLADLGEAIGEVGDADDPDILDKLDAASAFIEPLAGKYEDYLSQLAGLNTALGEFLAEQWWVSEDDEELAMKINGLPLSVGSLKASNEKMKEMADSLAALGEGAGVAVDTANKIVTTAEVSHKVLTTAQMVGGVGALVHTGATLLVKEGIKACAKQAAIAASQWTASAVAAAAGNYALNLLDLDEDTRYWLKVGLDAYQIFAFLKAANAKVQPGSACFVAGTQVIIGQREDGSFITKDIEDIEIGDLVFSRDQYDPDDDLDLRAVTEVFRKTSDHVRVLQIQDAEGNIETIRTTDEHPFYVEGRGWMGAGELVIGATLDQPDGSDAIVIGSTREAHADGITVFNFEVKGDHTYFVEDGQGDATAIWVHNTCVGSKFLSSYRGKPVEFDNAREATFFKRDNTSYDLIYNEFQSSKKKNWLKKIAQDDAAVQQLRAARMTESQIQRMRDFGELPNSKWNVHHKQAIILGGDNSDDNLMIFKEIDAAYHSALTTGQTTIKNEIQNVGDVVERNFPMFDGVVIFDR
jgi:hypothetical protein